jgi:hypothetical protein
MTRSLISALTAVRAGGLELADAVARFISSFASCRPVPARRPCGTSMRTWPPRRGTRRCGRNAGEATSRTYGLSEFLVDVLGVADVEAFFPHPGTYHPARQLRSEVPFPAAERALPDGQLRRNLRHATRTIREKRAHAVAELADGRSSGWSGGARLPERVHRYTRTARVRLGLPRLVSAGAGPSGPRRLAGRALPRRGRDPGW